jgi:uncharacterized protein YabN with tetrapyrrole methylase and pyrophosphatase domain
MGAGSLTVVGTGIGGCGQLTFESSNIIAISEKVLFLTANRETADWIKQVNPTSESLFPFYAGRSDRLQTYLDMTDHILSYVRQKLDVCAVFYGHPGVFVFPSHEAIIRAREEGFEARMLPAISAEDCLFSDLGVDPGHDGCQSFEATDFLVRKRQIDITVPLILWQIGSLGRLDHAPHHDNRNISILSETLQALYGPRHEVVIYEAAANSLSDSIIEFVPLDSLTATGVTLISTLYVPPKDEPLIDYEMARRLGIPEGYFLNARGRAQRYGVSRPYANAKPRRGRNGI